ncbi:MAG: GNAT family N-acetyltransferase [Arsenophonus endosymbiont of Dermacentor nuttalli]
MSNKEKYRQLCKRESTIPVFSQAWWLDAVAGENWDVAVVDKGEEIQAVMPYVLKKRYGQTVLTQPPLTQHLGPWLRATKAKYAKSLVREKDLLQALIDQLPIYTLYAQNWGPNNTNWLPLYWRGFKQTTRYTYRIEKLTDLDEVWAGFQENIKTDIRKAKNRFNITVQNDLSVEQFLHINEKTFLRQGKKLPYGHHLVQRIDQAAVANNARKIFIAVDNEGRHHAAVYLIWDRHSAYYWMGGGDPELRNSGATSLCMWEAINFASTVTEKFDFEGSMIEPIERFFRGFGAIQTPYFQIWHAPSNLIKFAMFLRSLSR